MRNVRLIAALGLAGMALSACGKGKPPAPDQNMSLDDGLPSGMAGNADIETLPADESSTTPSNQLQNGFDDADLNDVGPANSE